MLYDCYFCRFIYNIGVIEFSRSNNNTTIDSKNTYPTFKDIKKQFELENIHLKNLV